MDRLNQLLQFYEEDSDDPFTRFALAQEYLSRGQVDEALDFFEGLIDTDPDYVGTYYHLGKLYERLDRTEEAIATYEDGIEVARDQGEQKSLSELQDALMAARGVGFEDD